MAGKPAGGIIFTRDSATMKKYQAIINFTMDDNFMSHIPAHREYINNLIEQGMIDQYVVSMETQRIWITVTAEEKKDVEDILAKSPLFSYWVFQVEEIYLYDGRLYRLPAVQLN